MIIYQYIYLFLNKYAFNNNRLEVFKIKTKNFNPKIIGLLTGLVFGWLLQKGGVTDYNVLINQLLLKDFTVFKIILTAVLTGMIGIYFLKYRGLIQLHLKSGSIGSLITGGLLFGVGFGLLGYCPGTLAGAVGQGSMDALLAGLPGILLGAAFYARIYPKIQTSFFEKQPLKKLSIPEYFDLNNQIVITAAAFIILLVLFIIEILI